MKTFNIVVAIDRCGGIGKDGQLPWRLPGELRHFKEITTKVRDPSLKNAVIMGRKTWESLPAKFRPLPERFNVVLTRSASSSSLSIQADVLVAAALDEALAFLERKAIESIFVIGGAEIYRQAIEHESLKRIYLTTIDHDFSCDVFFPQIGKGFELLSTSRSMEENGLTYQFLVYERTATGAAASG